MSQDFLTGLGLAIVFFTVSVMLKLMFVSERPAPFLRLLICAWPLSALVGMGVPMVLLPFGPDVSAEGLTLHYADTLGIVVGATVLGLTGAFFTPRDRAQGAGLGLVAGSALSLASGMPLNGFGGAPKVALALAIASGGTFFFRALLSRNRQEMPQRTQDRLEPAWASTWLGRGDVSRQPRAEAETTASKSQGPAALPQADRPELLRAPPDDRPSLDGPPSPEFLTHALFAAAGAAVMAGLVILAGGMAGERILSAILLRPLQWLTTPMLIGAAGGASASFLLKRRSL